MYNKKSDYALNKKNKEAIVSRNAAGEIIQITKDEFASEEEFTYWKEWLDNEYRLEYNTEQSYKRLKNKLQKQTDDNAFSPSVEQILLSDLADEEKKVLVNKIKSILTETQFRRLWLYYVEELSMTKIAEEDGVTEASVSESIAAAKKKISKTFNNL